jgi:hypothetical protein
MRHSRSGVDKNDEQVAAARKEGPALRIAGALAQMSCVAVPKRTKRKKNDRPEPSLGEFSGHATALCIKSHRGG